MSLQPPVTGYRPPQGGGVTFGEADPVGREIVQGDFVQGET